MADDTLTIEVDKFIDTLSKQSMPALASTVHNMSQLTSADDSRVSQLTEQVLKDPTLTTRLLQVSNSVIYRGTSGQVSTITRAILLMGFAAIRDISMSMKIIDEMLKNSPTQHLKNVMAKSFHAAMQAKGMANKVKSGVKEEIFIASLLHHLGEMSVLSREDDLSRELDYLITIKGIPPELAAKQLLGFTFNDLTLGLAGSWELGDLVKQAVNPPSTLPRPVEAVLLGEELSQIAGLGWDSEPVSQVVERIATFRDVDVDTALDQVKEVADYSREVASQYGAAAVKHLIPPSNYTAEVAKKLNVITYEEPSVEPDKPAKIMVELDITPDMIEAALQYIPLPSMEKLQEQASANAKEPEQDTVARFIEKTELSIRSSPTLDRVIDGRPAKDKVDATLHMEYMHKIGDLLAGSKVNVNEMFVLILEAINKALGLERVVMALLSRDRKSINAKLFRGDILPEFESTFNFKVDEENAFSHALGQSQSFWAGSAKTAGKDYLITQSIEDCVGEGGFFVAPIVVTRKPIGVIYADQHISNAKLTDQQFLNFSMITQQASTALSMMKN